MAQITVKPCSINYAPLSSGDVRTGEIQHVRGGGRGGFIGSGAIAMGLTFVQSGAVVSGNNMLVMAGAGRLNSVSLITPVPTLSGVGITFYDSSTCAVSGTAVTGVKILAAFNAAGGQSGQFTTAGSVVNVDLPFQSGLGISAASGAPGFSFSYTPEVSVAFPNP